MTDFEASAPSHGITNASCARGDTSAPRRCWVAMLGLCLAATLALAPNSPAPAHSPKSPAPTLEQLDEKRFELHIGGRGGVRMLDGVSLGGGAQIGLGVRLWKGLYLEAGVGEAVFTNVEARESEVAFRHIGTHEDASMSALAPTPSPTSAPSPILAGQIVMGLRYEVRTDRTIWVRPSVYLGATHLHEATLDDFVVAPGKTLAGTGEFIRHRTGATLGLGLRVPLPLRWGPVAPRFSARFDADASYYFDRHPGRVQAGLGVGLQVVF